MSVWCGKGACWKEERGREKEKEMKFNAEWIMEYVSLPTVCCSERVREWNSCAEGAEIKTENAAVCFRRSAMYCMNCLRLPCRTDISEIHHFSPFAFNKKTCPPAKVHIHCFTTTFSRENKTVRSSSQILGFVKMYRGAFWGRLALCESPLPCISFLCEGLAGEIRITENCCCCVALSR